MDTPKNINNGFTLLEVMMVIAVIAVLVTVAVPGFLKWLPDYRLRSAAREVISCFQEMKMTAISENTNVVAAFNLTSGEYFSFVDNGEGGGVKDDDTHNGAEPVLRTVDMPSGVSMTATTFKLITPVYVVGFNSRGLLVGASTGGYITIQNTNSKTRKISINSAGGIKVE